MTKLKFKSDIFKSIFYNFFIDIFYNFFHIYVKMSKNVSDKCCQENKETLQKKLEKDIKIFLKKKTKKRANMVVNVPNISQKMKNKSLLSIEKNIIE